MKEILELLDIEELLLLKRIMELDKYGDGVDVRELGYRKNDITIQKLIKLGILEVSYASSKYFCVKVRKEVRDILDYIIKEKTREITDEDIDRVLSEIYNYDDIKKKIKKAIKYKQCIVLVGPPGVGKSEFLLKLSKLPRTVYLSGVSLKKEQVALVIERALRGLIEVILIDELDKVHRSVIDSIIKLYDNLKNRVSIIATANIMRMVPDWIKDRFYTIEVNIDEDTAVEVIKKELREKGVEVSEDIIRKVYKEEKSIRRAVSRIILDYV